MIEIHDGFLHVVFDQGAKAFHRSRRRIDIGHADGKGYTARRRRHRCSGHILFMRKTRISMMGVCVD